jgi:4-hydroxy-tetrahydrodipicolinate synthase
MTLPVFGRVLTAMVTPFTVDGSLDLDRAAELATRLVDQGNEGLVVSGTTGESPTTSRTEQAELLRAVVDAVGDRAHVLAGVGTNDTAHSVELAQDAQKAGATGLLAVTPYYSKPPQRGIIAHTVAVAESTELPVMLYDIPGRTGVALSHETLVELAAHPQVVAVKDAKDDLVATSRLLAETDLQVYSGTDALNLPILALGGVGYVSVVGHLVASQLREMTAAFLAGDVARAAQINRELQPVYGGLFRTQGVILTKAALDLLGFPVGGVRLPLVEATTEEREVLHADLLAAGLLP